MVNNGYSLFAEEVISRPQYAEEFIKSFQFTTVRLQLHGAIYRPNSFVTMPRYCANLKVIRYESTSLNRTVVDKSHRVIVA